MKHRRCTKRRHHRWQYRLTLMGYTIARCVMCGKEDLA